MSGPSPEPLRPADADTPYLRAVARVMARITAAADREGVLDALAEGLVAELGVDLVRIWLYDPADDALHLRARATGTGLVPDSVSRLTRRDRQAPIVRAIQSRAPLVIDRIRSEDGIGGADALLREGLRAYAGIPLMAGEQLCGGLSTFRREPIPAPLLEALGVVGQQAALALEHARLIEESHTLQTVAAELASARDTQGLLEGIVERTVGALGADACAVWLLDESTGNLVPSATCGLSAAFLNRVLTQPLRPGMQTTTAVFNELQRTGRPLFTPDARADADRRTSALAGALAEEGIVSALRLPLFEPGRRVIGMLALYHRRERLYSESEVRLAQAFTDQIAVALHNARLAEQERQAREEAARLAEQERAARETAARQLDRLTTLAGITQQLLAATELETVLNVVVESAMRLCGTSGAAVSLIDPDGLSLRSAAARGTAHGLFALLESGQPLDEFYLTRTATGQAITQGTAIAVDDYTAWEVTPEWRETTMAAGVRAFMVAPLRVGDTSIGVLWAGGPEPRTFAPEDRALVEALADEAALAIEHARLLARSREAAALEERTRLARDLHDSVTQTIAALALLAQAAQVQHTRGHPSLGHTLQRVGTLAQEAMAETRALLFELQPATLAEEGLAGALEKLVAAVRVRVDVPISYTGTATTRLTSDAELAIFRIVQEALANACKYAEATAITVTLAQAEGQVSVIVADDGVGFDPAAPVASSSQGKPGGMGLRSMRERAATAGLNLRVDSAPGAGTRVTVAAPVPAPRRD